jgi:hypothetical protein
VTKEHPVRAVPGCGPRRGCGDDHKRPQARHRPCGTTRVFPSTAGGQQTARSCPEAHNCIKAGGLAEHRGISPLHEGCATATWPVTGFTSVSPIAMPTGHRPRTFSTVGVGACSTARGASDRSPGCTSGGDPATRTRCTPTSSSLVLVVGACAVGGIAGPLSGREPSVVAGLRVLDNPSTGRT